jgi:hypothetical protein
MWRGHSRTFLAEILALWHGLTLLWHGLTTVPQQRHNNCLYPAQWASVKALAAVTCRGARLAEEKFITACRDKFHPLLPFPV